MKPEFPNASEAFKKLNPNLFNLAPRLPDTEREPITVQTLDSCQKRERASKSRVAVCITITSYRKRDCDLDNIIAGAKALRDSIAASLQIDDGSPLIRWEYHTIVTRGRPGTHVLISCV